MCGRFLYAISQVNIRWQMNIWLTGVIKDEKIKYMLTSVYAGDII